MLRATGTNVLVELSQEERVSPGGIVLPSQDEGLNMAKVISIGPGGKEDSPPCKAGDMVLFFIDYYDQRKMVTKEDKKYLFLRFCEILAVEE